MKTYGKSQVKINRNRIVSVVFACTASMLHANAAEPSGFPYGLRDKKPDRPLSVAMERLYDHYPAPTPEKNELFSNFRYTRLEGFDYHNHDGTISR